MLRSGGGIFGNPPRLDKFYFLGIWRENPFFTFGSCLKKCPFLCPIWKPAKFIKNFFWGSGFFQVRSYVF